jgi:hypothetical protein
MLAAYFKHPFTLRKLRSGPAGPYLDDFASHLAEAGYSRDKVEYRPHKRPYPQVARVSSRHQAAVNLPATRYRPESQPLAPGNGPQEKAIWDGF